MTPGPPSSVGFLRVAQVCAGRSHLFHRTFLLPKVRGKGPGNGPVTNSVDCSRRDLKII